MTFEDSAQQIMDLIDKEIRPAMKKMTGRYWQKVVDHLAEIEKKADTMRREAKNIGI